MVNYLVLMVFSFLVKDQEYLKNLCTTEDQIVIYYFFLNKNTL
jgi:hypothetical protein